MINRLVYILITIVLVSSAQARTIRVLAIGNSFSEDAVEQNLYNLAFEQGDTLIIGNAYIGGCDINRHLDNIISAKPDYAYRKIVDGRKTSIESVDLPSIIADEKWDIITLQQASHFSGKKDTYDNLPALRQAVADLMPDKNAEIVWHMTWSYAKDSTHPGFKYYGNNQQAMTDSINAAVKAKVMPVGISRIIPAGRAIALGRTIFGNSLTRDGYHLAYELGRYTAACVWCEFITGRPVVGNPYHPADISAQQALAAQLAAHAAL